jgi:hypothetical protein
MDYVNWNPDEPNNKGGKENCGHLTADNPKTYGTWNDISCYQKLGFVCKIRKTLQTND